MHKPNVRASLFSFERKALLSAIDPINHNFTIMNLKTNLRPKFQYLALLSSWQLEVLQRAEPEKVVADLSYDPR